MKNLEQLIKLAKENDENAMLDIIEKFQPVINKYFIKSCYNKDVKSALELKLIELIKCEINLDNMRELNEGSLVNYIAASLYHQYIAISSGKNSVKLKLEILCEDNILIDLNESVDFYDSNIDDRILFESLRGLLTEREFDCVYYIVFEGYTAAELAEYLHISKQACNQCKRRALEKIREFFEKE